LARGEPLATGIKHFDKIILPFSKKGLESKVQHNIQTNATLINEAWCELFKNYNFKVGVSVDGPPELNSKRKDLHGFQTYFRILKGIEYLSDYNIPFSIIAVVSEDSLDSATEIYEFAQDTGCKSLCINIEEKEGVNLGGVKSTEKVKEFWRQLYVAWRDSPSVRVREFDRLFRRMDFICKNKETIKNEMLPLEVELIPTISSSGEVILLSPEFADISGDKNYNFSVGNILEEPLRLILERGIKSYYVQDFIKGVRQCREECPYYSVCGGGQASNKYFEHKNINTSETQYCRNTKMALTDAILELV